MKHDRESCHTCNCTDYPCEELQAEVIATQRTEIDSLKASNEKLLTALKYIADRKWAAGVSKWGMEFAEVAEQSLAEYEELFQKVEKDILA